MRCFFGNKSISTATTIHGNVSYAMKRNKNLGKLAKVSKSLQGHSTMRVRGAKNKKHALIHKQSEIWFLNISHARKILVIFKYWGPSFHIRTCDYLTDDLSLTNVCKHEASYRHRCKRVSCNHKVNTPWRHTSCIAFLFKRQTSSLLFYAYV